MQRLKQKQTEKQVQRLSPQQVMSVRLLEMPVMTLKEKIDNELVDNFALEVTDERRDLADERIEAEEGRESRRDDNVLYDEYDDYGSGYSDYDTDNGQLSSTHSFMDDLSEQIGEYDVTDHQRQLIEYLIGSLDDRGYLDRPLRKIEDDLVIYQNVDTNQQELEEALSILQQFDPPGIGARNLQECLSLQLHRIEENAEHVPFSLRVAREIIDNYYNYVSQPRIISQKMKVSYQDVEDAVSIISKLNPSPGLSLNESVSDRAKTVVPDFIIQTTDDGDVTFTLNQGDIPELQINPEYQQQLASYQAHAAQLTRHRKEAYQYTKEKVDSAKMFIDAVRQRQHTLYITMQAIIEMQKPFMLSQDENDLLPLKLEDVAKRTEQDISTVSRVKNSKYALLDGTLYPVSSFFLRTRNNAQGEEIAGNRVNRLIRELIDQENKKHPYSDQQLEALLKEQGLNISRRTVAKYRKQMGIPIATRRR